MPTLQANTGVKVLVTGVNGYVATGVAKELLEQGFAVRGTVRSQSKGEQMKALFSSYGDKFEWVIVEDITKEGAFDGALKGIEAVEHMASPLPGQLPDEDPQLVYIKPAVQGTLSILNSILKYGLKVKRVVLTSSIGAIMPPLDGPAILDEDNWADKFVEIVEKKGKDASAVEKYIASKTLAERAAWDFHAKNRKEGGWDLVVINPSNILGPQFQDFKDLKEISRSISFWYEFMTMELPEESLLSTLAYVDIRDVAEAHVEVLRKEAAGGHRIILSAGCITWQEARNQLLSLKPEYYSSGGILKRGNPELKGKISYIFNSKKAQDMLGINYRSLEETTSSTVREFEQRGFLP